MKNVLVFGDIETGGLNGLLENNHLGMQYYPILELAFIITDEQLNQIGEPLRLVIHQSEEEILICDPWALETHTKSGLLEEVRASTLTLEQAEQVIINHLKALGVEAYNRKEKTGAIFVGNSIMFDRSYLLCQMPAIHEYMHYRQLDISAIALAVRMWLPAMEKEIKKDYKHEALADIQESIEELRFYKEHLFDSSIKSAIKRGHGQFAMVN